MSAGVYARSHVRRGVRGRRTTGYAREAYGSETYDARPAPLSRPT
ncbi:hypothetical protein [Streptomyces ipomoeae]|nr:hypothetical protein [Streptomyces ipomoeae]MDX2931886.1 hypothetical protein [Streptomyces ipomoeae]